MLAEKGVRALLLAMSILIHHECHDDENDQSCSTNAKIRGGASDGHTWVSRWWLGR